MADIGTLSTVASIISGFGVAMLFFRIQRELNVREQKQIDWIPKADWLLMVATMVSLLLVILPIVSLNLKSRGLLRLPSAACAASTVLLAGYLPSILAHYRLLFGRNRSGPRVNPEPAERWLVRVTLAAAFVVFMVVLLTLKPAT